MKFKSRFKLKKEELLCLKIIIEKYRKFLNKFLILSGFIATFNMGPIIKAMPNNDFKVIKKTKKAIEIIETSKFNKIPKNLKKLYSKKNKSIQKPKLPLYYDRTIGQEVKTYDILNRNGTFRTVIENIKNRKLPRNLKIKSNLNVNSNGEYNMNSDLYEYILNYNKLYFKNNDEDNIFGRRYEEENSIQKITTLYNKNNEYILKLKNLFSEINTNFNLKINIKKDKITTDFMNLTFVPESSKARQVILLEEEKTIKEIVEEMKEAKLKYINTVTNLFKKLNEEKIKHKRENLREFNNLGYYLLNIHNTKIQKECIDVLKSEEEILTRATFSLISLKNKRTRTKNEVIKELINSFALIRNLYLNEYHLTIEQQNTKAKEIIDLYKKSHKNENKNYKSTHIF